MWSCLPSARESCYYKLTLPESARLTKSPSPSPTSNSVEQPILAAVPSGSNANLSATRTDPSSASPRQNGFSLLIRPLLRRRISQAAHHPAPFPLQARSKLQLRRWRQRVL